MFDNVGEKIKAISVVFLILDIILSLAAFIWIIIDIGAIGFLALINIPFAYFGSCFIYGFGELIETTGDINDLLVMSKKNELFKSKEPEETKKPEEITTAKATNYTPKTIKVTVNKDTSSHESQLLCENLNTALKFSSDASMIAYLKGLHHDDINEILTAPEEDIRSLIAEYINKLK